MCALLCTMNTLSELPEKQDRDDWDRLKLTGPRRNVILFQTTHPMLVSMIVASYFFLEELLERDNWQEEEEKKAML